MDLKVNVLRLQHYISGTSFNRSQTWLENNPGFPVNTEKGEKADALIPEGFTGYIECALDGEFQVGSVAMIIGEALKAGASKDGFTDRVSPEKESGRTIHHLGGGVFGILSPEVNEK